MDYRLGLYEKAVPVNFSLKKKLDFCKSAGFDFMELSIDETDEKLERLDMPFNDRLKIVSYGLKSGARFESICLSAHRKYPLGSRNSNIQERAVQILKKAVCLAGDLGIRIIQLAGYDEYYNDSNEETVKIFEEGLRVCTDYAGQFGVILAFETMETVFMNTVAKAMYYVDKLKSPYLGVYPDIGNVTNSGVDVVKDLRSGQGSIFAVHLKETKPDIFREVPFGEGHVNFTQAVTACKDLGVNRYLAEMWCNNTDGWRKEVLRSGEFLRKILDKVYHL